MTAAVDSVLTEDEMATMKRFCVALTDVGIRALLIQQILSSSNQSQPMAQVLEASLEDVVSTGAAKMERSAPSLSFVWATASAIGYFPSDCLPSEETVMKCFDLFWDNIRTSS